MRRRLADGSIRTYAYNALDYAGGRARIEKQPAVQHLSAQWKQSPEWARLAPSTKWLYGLALGRIEDALGWMSLSDIDSRVAKPKFYKLRDSLADRPGTADYTMAVLSSMLSWAARRNLIDVNRARDIPRLSESNTRASIVLERQDEPALLAAARPDLVPLVQAALLTGLRIGDLCRLTRAMVGRDGWLVVTPEKTRRHGIVVTVPPAIVARFAAAQGDVLLPRRDGSAWSKKRAGEVWAEARAAAALPHLHFHDLRGTLAERLFEAGCTDAEAAAVLGKRIGKGSMTAYVQRTRTLTLNAHAKLARVVDFPAEKENAKTRA